MLAACYSFDMLIAYRKSALRALLRMPPSTARSIRSKIEQYAADPASLANNVKRLRGRDGYRLRVGDYRVIFDQDGVVMDIIEVGLRGSIDEE
ncbi:type II toxin-antitoxin system RelE/ParE family toxin [Rhodoplanes azumiensis]|uniref:Type II toxin-antitoxin system RelE/ParE family toxin n=1 Tax=Rhodoplanes azumiensis TaxID=1897628 RepID=A0ABW5AIJ1_9BRAD